MATEKMYDLAFQYKAAKLWKLLYDDEVFAVKLPDGETGYCSVMGMIGQHLALPELPHIAGCGICGCR